MRELRKLMCAAFVIAAMIFSSESSWAAAVRWDSGPGNNGHWYEAFISTPGIFWEDAQADAVSRGGYLATLLSAEENAFAFGLIDSAAYWQFESGGGGANLGPWIGGYQEPCSPEAACGWNWLNGEGAFAYTNWHSGEPNNGWGGESRLHFFEYGGRSNLWNDLGSNVESRPIGFNMPIGYVVEYDSDPNRVPEPASLLLLGCGAIVAGLAKRILK